MNIFLTGGSGFIGKFIVQKLDNAANKLLILTRNPQSLTHSKNVTILEGELAKIGKWEKLLKEFKPQATIHLAWEGIPDYGYQNSIRNLKYGLKLLELLAKLKCQKILVAGSLWEYGVQIGKVSEEASIKPFNAFTAAKNSFYLLGSELTKEYNMIFLWTRLFNVYGPGQKETSLIPYLINCANNNKEIAIRNPNAKNDFIYVEDVAEAINQILLKCNKSDIFNIGSGKLVSVQTILGKIFNFFDAKQRHKKVKQKQTDALSYFYADITKIKTDIGWKPKVSLDRGIRKTIDYLVSI